MLRKPLLTCLLACAWMLAAPYTQAQSTPEKPRIIVAVGGKSLFYYLPLTIAERLGYFKDEGVKVDLHDFPGGAKSLQALIGGSADMAAGSFEHVINMQAKNQDIRAVVLQVRYPGIVLAIKNELAARYKSPRDLRSLKVGVTAPGSSTHMFLSNLLAKDGLRPNDVSVIGIGATAGAVAAMRRGEIDAMAHLDPVIHQLESSGHILVVVDTRSEKGAKQVYGGAYHAACMYASEDFIRKHPRTVQAMVNAIVRALRWLQQATPDQIVAAVPPEYWGNDKNAYKAALVKNLPTLSPDGVLGMEGAQNVLTALKAFEPFVRNASIDLDKSMDGSFVDKALAKYGK